MDEYCSSHLIVQPSVVQTLNISKLQKQNSAILKQNEVRLSNYSRQALPVERSPV